MTTRLPGLVDWLCLNVWQGQASSARISSMLGKNSVLFLLLSFQCSESCDGGIQRRRAICVNTQNDVLDDSKCTHQEKVTVQGCNEFPCPRWKSGDWSEVRGQGCHFPWVITDIPTLTHSLPRAVQG